jgi:adenylate cyclase
LQALPLLQRALALEPNYALAHGQAALCHEILFVRAGRREGNRINAIHHGHAAITLGQTMPGR